MNKYEIESAARALGLRSPKTKPRVFVSYHHKNDQLWYDEFSRLFGDVYDVVTDRSLDREVYSTDSAYVMRVIREQHIKGSSLTVVLCGAETHKRKYVDWEIKATLEKEHALLGILLGSNPNRFVPDRFLDNVNSGYASYVNWPQSAQELAAGIDGAISRARQTRLINNSRTMMSRNHS